MPVQSNTLLKPVDIYCLRHTMLDHCFPLCCMVQGSCQLFIGSRPGLCVTTTVPIVGCSTCAERALVSSSIGSPCSARLTCRSPGASILFLSLFPVTRPADVSRAGTLATQNTKHIVPCRHRSLSHPHHCFLQVSTGYIQIVPASLDQQAVEIGRQVHRHTTQQGVFPSRHLGDTRPGQHPSQHPSHHSM
jgi:hypothetical protein